jgi:integrase
MEALGRHRDRQQQNREKFGDLYGADLDLIIADELGNYLEPDSVTAKVSLLMRQLGLPKGVSLHTLRHTHGSHLLSRGVPLPAVSKRLGHANTNTTATIYAHALEADDRLAADVWDSFTETARKSLKNW